MHKTLIYVHDPMCSWCFGFEPVRRQIFDQLEGEMLLRRVLGGLAPDADEPMPEAMREGLQQTWRHIEQVIPGTRFNFDFWRLCTPRRSTYPANRAVIAAREQGADFDPAMTARIQQAYYREARNPSDDETLIELAADIGLDAERFADCLREPSTQQQLLQEIRYARSIGADSFPSLLLEDERGIRPIGLNYLDAAAMLREIRAD